MIFATITIVVYTIALLLIFLYALAQLNLLFNYLASKKHIDDSVTFDFSNSEEIPYVTIQLPVYNEMYVMDRLLENIALIDYPKDKLEIQVLDDSTDETLKSTFDHIEKLKQTGLDIQHITRIDRTGFKAGALKEGLKTVKGEFIAIFDSDFLPKKDWLKKTMLEMEGNISATDLDLFNVVDTATEAVAVIDDFYSKYNLSPNF